MIYQYFPEDLKLTPIKYPGTCFSNTPKHYYIVVGLSTNAVHNNLFEETIIIHSMLWLYGRA